MDYMMEQRIGQINQAEEEMRWLRRDGDGYVLAWWEGVYEASASASQPVKVSWKGKN